MNDTELFAAFSSRTLAEKEWTHVAHLRVAYLHLDRYPSLEEAHLKIRVGIIRLNTVHGLEETLARGYHETLTRVWIALVAAARTLDRAGDSAAFLTLHEALLSRDAPLRHYSKARLFSPEARSIFVPPDLVPLPVLDLPA